MSDQAPNVDSPEDAASQADGGQQQTQEIDWQKRATDHQAAYTQSQQELARYRQELEERNQLIAAAQSGDREAVERLGFQLYAEEEDGQYTDPNEQLARELAELKQWRDEFTGAQQQEQQVARIEASVEQQLDKIGGLDEEDKDWIVSRAIALPPTSDGLPDIKAAYDQLVARDQKRLQSWAKTKPRSAFTSAGGQEGTQVPDLSNREQRQQWMLSELQGRQ